MLYGNFFQTCSQYPVRGWASGGAVYSLYYIIANMRVFIDVLHIFDPAQIITMPQSFAEYQMTYICITIYKYIF